MKLNLNSFGTLVRPRILSHARLYPSVDPTVLEEDRWDVSTVTDSFYRGPKDLLNHTKSLDIFFQNLKLGDTTVSLENCYTGVITHFIINVGFRQHLIVNSLNSKEIIEKLKEKYKQFNIKNLYYRIQYVGIKLYKSIELNSDQELIPTNSWNEQEDFIWFYRPWDLVSMESIIEYENLIPSNLVLFKKTNGLVLGNKFLNKTKFYKTNSWSCRSITILSKNGRKRKTFLPDRKFKRLKS